MLKVFLLYGLALICYSVSLIVHEIRIARLEKLLEKGDKNA